MGVGRRDSKSTTIGSSGGPKFKEKKKGELS